MVTTEYRVFEIVGIGYQEQLFTEVKVNIYPIH